MSFSVICHLFHGALSIKRKQVAFGFASRNEAAQEAIQPAQRRILQIDSTGKAHPIVTHE